MPARTYRPVQVQGRGAPAPWRGSRRKYKVPLRSHNNTLHDTARIGAQGHINMTDTIDLRGNQRVPSTFVVPNDGGVKVRHFRL